MCLSELTVPQSGYDWDKLQGKYHVRVINSSVGRGKIRIPFHYDHTGTFGGEMGIPSMAEVKGTASVTK